MTKKVIYVRKIFLEEYGERFIRQIYESKGYEVEIKALSGAEKPPEINAESRRVFRRGPMIDHV